MIPESWIAELKRRAKASEVVGKYVDLKRGSNKNEFIGLSPFRTDNKVGSFTVSDDKGIIHDFATGESWDVISFIRQIKGCEFREAAEELGAMYNLLLPEKPTNGHAKAHREKLIQKATYDYTTDDDALAFQVVRYVSSESGEKTFRQRRPDGNGGWIWNVDGVRMVPYRLPDLLAHDRTVPVLIVEGEKDVDSLRALAVTATTNARGAGKWQPELNEYFLEYDVIIVADNDKPGRDHAEVVAKNLNGIAARVRVLNLADHWAACPVKGDVTDYLEQGGTIETLVKWADATVDWIPPAPKEQTLIQSSAQFVRGFIPPDYLFDGILQRRFFYSMTGRTGAGKTAILLRFAAHNALGKAIGNIEVEKGRVLYLAGENPDDIRMRWIAMAQHVPFDVEAIDVYFIPGTFKISELSARITAEAAAIGGVFSLVVVDTSAAFYEGTDENDNVQAGKHARMLRRLVDIVPGGPTVITACHPPKNAPADCLLPRGGGAFVAEVDGNLTSEITEGITEMHWQGKFRGPDFAPVAFKLDTVTHQDLKDSKGRKIPTVIASHLSNVAQEEMAAAALNDENRVLQAIADDPEVSRSARALTLGWLTRDGQPYKKRVERIEAKLKKQKLIKVERNGSPTILPAGRAALEKISAPRRREAA